MTEIEKILIERDGMSPGNARELLEEAREAVYADGEDPEEILADWFGLEPDYLMDLLEG